MQLRKVNLSISQHTDGSTGCCDDRYGVSAGFAFMMAATSIGAIASTNIVENPEIAIEASENRF